ncbi:hypothetical protein YC2023_066796 [Brassica napus]
MGKLGGSGFCDCKSWDKLFKYLIFGKAVARKPFLGFMTMDYKLFSVRFDLQGIPNGMCYASLNTMRMRRSWCGIRIWDKQGGSNLYETSKPLTSMHLDTTAKGRAFRGSTNTYKTAYIIGEECFKSVRLGESRKDWRRKLVCGFGVGMFYPPHLFSSYLPSLVQVNQPHKKNERDT